MTSSTLGEVEAGNAPSPRVADMQVADLPKRQLPFWKMTGPGAVLVGLSIGAGEIVIWPRIVAQYGPGMIWAAVLGVLLQLWVNIEIGRWTVATGESAYRGFARVWKGFALAFVLFNFFGWYFPGWARVSGTALKALILRPDHPTPDWLWTAITFGMVGALLFGPKKVYGAVEKSVSAMVAIITIGLLVIAIKVGTSGQVVELLKGIVNVGYKAPGFSGKDLFIALVFAGAGGTANLFYSFYLRDKHIGMGARVPALLNPFRKRQQADAATSGYRFPDTPENARTFKDWLRYVMLDQVLYFWLLNTFTLLLFIFGSLAVLHPKGLVPAQGSLIWDEAIVLSESMGSFGRYLFLVIGLATLFSTQLTLVDGVSRSLADICHGTFRFGKRFPESTWYAGWAVFMMLFGVVITVILELRGVSDLGFLFNAAYIGGFAMAVYVPLILFINLRYLPKGARPGPLHITLTSIAAAVYIGFALYSLWYELHTRGFF